MSYQGQWSGAQIDAAINNWKNIESKLKRWENQAIAIIEYGKSSIPSFMKEGIGNKKIARWMEVSDSEKVPYRYSAKCFFNTEWDLSYNFPVVLFFNEKLERLECDYKFIKDFEGRGSRNIGIEVFSNSNELIIAFCFNHGIVANLEQTIPFEEPLSCFQWNIRKKYSQGSVTFYRENGINYWIRSRKQNNIGNLPTSEEWWERLDYFFKDDTLEKTQNKVNEISGQNIDDIHYPSCKAVSLITNSLNSNVEKVGKILEMGELGITFLENFNYSWNQIDQGIIYTEEDWTPETKKAQLSSTAKNWKVNATFGLCTKDEDSGEIQEMPETLKELNTTGYNVEDFVNFYGAESRVSIYFDDDNKQVCIKIDGVTKPYASNIKIIPGVQFTVEEYSIKL